MLRKLPTDVHDPDSALVRAALAAADGDVDACADELASARAARVGHVLAQPRRSSWPLTWSTPSGRRWLANPTAAGAR